MVAAAVPGRLHRQEALNPTVATQRSRKNRTRLKSPGLAARAAAPAAVKESRLNRQEAVVSGLNPFHLCSRRLMKAALDFVLESVGRHCREAVRAVLSRLPSPGRAALSTLAFAAVGWMGRAWLVPAFLRLIEAHPIRLVRFVARRFLIPRLAAAVFRILLHRRAADRVRRRSGPIVRF